jgi:hypothetical protein
MGLGCGDSWHKRYGHVLHGLVNHLARRGHLVHVLTSQSSSPLASGSDRCMAVYYPDMSLLFEGPRVVLLKPS